MSNPLSPRGPVPSDAQLAYHRAPLAAFVHFGPNTFTGVEWGSGTEKADIFLPKSLDCRQWVKAFQSAGMTRGIITAKHHDGFCLWPTAYSEHSVASSGWKEGKGDVLAELSQACREAGLGFGVYLSPWDRNHPTYGDPKYNDTFVAMLGEVLTRYGDVVEVWFDGANGEGPNGRRQVYDWPRFIAAVRENAPNAVIFSDAGPDIRWVGNEAGFAKETNWNTLDRDRYQPGTPLYAELAEGQREGRYWVPNECDVSIRPGWFWRATEDDKVKTLEQLQEIWYGSIGRGAMLLINIPPNSDGLLSEPDVRRLAEFGAWQRECEKRIFRPADFGRQTTETCPRTGDRIAVVPSSLVVDLGAAFTFDHVDLKEAIGLGQRVARFAVDVRDGAGWREVATGTTIGNRRIIKVPPTTAEEIRVRIVEADGPALLTQVAVWKAL